MVLDQDYTQWSLKYKGLLDQRKCFHRYFIPLVGDLREICIGGDRQCAYKNSQGFRVQSGRRGVKTRLQAKTTLTGCAKVFTTTPQLSF